MELWELSAREAVRHTIASPRTRPTTGTSTTSRRSSRPTACSRSTEPVARSPGPRRDLGFFRGVGGDVVTHRAAGPDAAPRDERAGCGRVAERRAATCYFTVMTGAGVDHWGRYKDRFEPGNQATVGSSRTASCAPTGAHPAAGPTIVEALTRRRSTRTPRPAGSCRTRCGRRRRRRCGRPAASTSCGAGRTPGTRRARGGTRGPTRRR